MVYAIMARILKVFLPLCVLILLIIGGYFYWQHKKLYPSTNDAYVKADVLNIAPRISGKVTAVYVQDHQYVKQGQPLFDIDPTPFNIAVSQATAKLDSTRDQIAAANMAVQSSKAIVTQREAELLDTQAETKRIMAMVKKKYESESDGDLAIKNLRVAKAALLAAKSQLAQAIQKRGQMGPNNAQIRGAKAALDKAQLNLQYTHVAAPAAGHIANFSLREGAIVNAYQQLFAIIENQSWWASANFKETQLRRIHPGENATIKVDMYPQHIFHGKVASISGGSGTSFSLLPPENASGNWVKVTQRFPVKIVMMSGDPLYPLRLDASCTVTVDTASTHND